MGGLKPGGEGAGGLLLGGEGAGGRLFGGPFPQLLPLLPFGLPSLQPAPFCVHAIEK